MCKKISVFKSLFTILVLFSSASFLYATEHVHTVKRKTVKVGYYENESFQEGASEGAVKSGYSYEYLQKLSSITGWQYEYIYGSWSDIYNSFLNGEIDLLAGLGYSESRLSVMSYPEYPMGYESYYLYTASNDNSITIDAETLNGKRIGTISGLLYETMKNWLDERNVKSELVVFNDVRDRDIALDKGEIDAFIGESSSVVAKSQIKPLVKISSVNMYLCVAKKQT